MESIYTDLALYGRKKKCARTDTVFLPISEVCDSTVSLALTRDNYSQLIQLLQLETNIVSWANCSH